jgi:hypothetical protein
VVTQTGDLYRLGHCGLCLCDVELRRVQNPLPARRRGAPPSFSQRSTSTPTVSNGDRSSAVKRALRRLRDPAMTRTGSSCGATVGECLKRLRMRAGVASAITRSSISQKLRLAGVVKTDSTGEAGLRSPRYASKAPGNVQSEYEPIDQRAFAS